jgi:hypothetical protein
MEVVLGVREWYRCRAALGSGGLDSYTNVSSESETSASSIALATLASKISALDDAIPGTVGGFRVVFFFSFFGRMVSVLGFILIVPP